MTTKIALALGSGAARGWSHIGVIQALAHLNIRPSIICGSSIGALVGAVHACGHLEQLTQWLERITWLDSVRLADFQLQKGGFISGTNLMNFLSRFIDIKRIEELPMPFVAVATNLITGQEVWLKEGSVVDAVRASIALPGVFTPVQNRDRWLIDGGLVNPVPISACRAMGADRVIAVNLNGDIVGKHFNPSHRTIPTDVNGSADWELLQQLLAIMPDSLKDRARPFLNKNKPETAGPGLFDVLAGAINIMQDRITRSRMAGDPPDVLIAPRLSHIELMGFDRASECIQAGYDATLAQKTQLELVLR